MTTRRWMIAVAVVAMAMGIFVVARAVLRYFVALDRIAYHAGMEGTRSWLNPIGRDELREIDRMMDLIEKQQPITGDERLDEETRARIDEYRRISARLRRNMEYHAAMVRKYRYVARFPWLPVEPDPPEPRP
jgi:hypothetical protein